MHLGFRRYQIIIINLLNINLPIIFVAFMKSPFKLEIMEIGLSEYLFNINNTNTSAYK